LTVEVGAVQGGEVRRTKWVTPNWVADTMRQTDRRNVSGGWLKKLATAPSLVRKPLRVEFEYECPQGEDEGNLIAEGRLCLDGD
jgi:hypothetical protein